MNLERLESNIDRANDKFLVSDEEIVPDNHDKEEGNEQPSPIQLPIDVANMMHKRQVAESKMKRPHGASPRLKADIAYISKELEREYNIAKDTVNTLNANGDTARAKMAQSQYMSEKFLPFVEALTHIASADELVNAVSSLDELDKYVLTPGGSFENFLFETLFSCIVVILFLFDAKLYLFENTNTQILSFSYKKSQIVSN